MDPGRSEQSDPLVSPGQPAPTAEPGSAESPPEERANLPESSGETTLVAVPVDPNVVHCRWEVAPADIKHAQQALGVSEAEFWPVLQMHDVTHAAQDAPSERPVAVEVQLESGNCFVRSCSPERSYRADLGLRAEDGSFAVIASSDPVQTPPSAPSSYVDEQWLPIRIEPKQPEIAAPVRSPIDFVPEPPLSVPAEPAASPTRLPIDMREEVRGKLAVLYREFEPETLEGPLSSQPQAPTDMREEAMTLLNQLYPELESPPPGPPGVLNSPQETHAIEERPTEHALREPSVFLGTKESASADLTEMNERSFTTGISSTTK